MFPMLHTIKTAQNDTFTLFAFSNSDNIRPGFCQLPAILSETKRKAWALSICGAFMSRPRISHARIQFGQPAPQSHQLPWGPSPSLDTGFQWVIWCAAPSGKLARVTIIISNIDAKPLRALQPCAPTAPIAQTSYPDRVSLFRLPYRDGIKRLYLLFLHDVDVVRTPLVSTQSIVPSS